MLAERQHGVVARRQLLALGYSSKWVEHRIASGRLHPLWRGVYAFGRPQLTRYGRWMAAVLSCGPQSVLSHRSAAELWMMVPLGGDEIEVSLPASIMRRRPGIEVHRRTTLDPGNVTRHQSIPITIPLFTLIDLATRLGRAELEAAVNEADKRDLTDPESLRSLLDRFPGQPGARALRETLDQRTFALTDSELERRFLRLVQSAGLPAPKTGRYLNGFKVDFYWPELGLVVETDGLRYHRTPAQQARDRVRDQTHTASGLTPLRFTHAQVRFEPDRVRSTLVSVVRRLRSR